jgi:hypothetical protein
MPEVTFDVIQTETFADGSEVVVRQQAIAIPVGLTVAELFGWMDLPWESQKSIAQMLAMPLPDAARRVILLGLSSRPLRGG